MADELSEDGTEFWQKKCEEQEAIIKTFTVHCLKFVKKHEELLENYQATQSQYATLTEKFKEQKEELKEARDVIKTQEELFENCQTTQDQYATLVEKLKEQKEQVKRTKYELSAERARFGACVKLLTEDLDNQKEENLALTKRLEEFKAELGRSNARVTRQGKELEQLAQTSEETLLDYHSLLKQHEVELINHKAANTKVEQFQAESKAAKRESAALIRLSNISGDHKLIKALGDLEELATLYEADKMKFETKILTLERELEDERNRLGVQALEDETASITKERDDLLQRLADSEKLANEAQSRCSELQGKYFELEGKYEQSLNKPRIPIPPPPPPPPPLSSIKTGIMALIFKGKEKKNQLTKQMLNVAGAAVNQEAKDMLDELKKYLTGGKPLRPVMKSRTLSTPADSCGAASEVEGILRNMKKAKSEEDLTAMDDTFAEQESEFVKTFKKISQKKEGTNNSLSTDAYPRKLTTFKDEQEV